MGGPITSPDNEQGLKIIFPLVGRKDRNAIAAAVPLGG